MSTGKHDDRSGHRCIAVDGHGNIFNKPHDGFRNAVLRFAKSLSAELEFCARLDPGKVFDIDFARWSGATPVVTREPETGERLRRAVFDHIVVPRGRRHEAEAL